MANEDTYIFREKIRHPSKKDDWIIARDYGPLSTISDTERKSVTTAVTGFYFSDKSYNFIVDNNNDNITLTRNDEENATVNTSNIIWPTDIDTNGIRNIAVPGAIDQNITISDITDTIVVTGSYTDNMSTITIPNTVTAWTNTFITKEIDDSDTSIKNYVKQNDILIVPKVETNDSFTIDMYQIGNFQDTVSGFTTTYAFNYNSNNLSDSLKDRMILNVLSPQENGINSIKFTNMLNQFSPISSFQFEEDEDEAIALTSMIINNDNNNPVSGEDIPSYHLYGNGILLNRFTVNSQILNNLKFNYEWFLVENEENKYILNFQQKNSNYIIKNLIRVTVTRDNSSSIPALKLNFAESITTYNNNISNLSVGWTNDDLFQNDDIYLRYNLFGCYATASDNNNLSLTVTYNSQNDKENKIKEYYPAIGFTDTPVPNISYNTVIPTLMVYTDIAGAALNTITMTPTGETNYAGTLNIDNQSSNISLDYNNEAIIINNNIDIVQKWWDYILDSHNLLSYKDINLNWFWNNIEGTIQYTGTINNVYQLSQLSNNNIISKNSAYSYTNWWNNMYIVNNNNINSNKFVINYANSNLNISFPAENEILTYSLANNTNKLWILDKNTDIFSINNSYYIVDDLLQSPIKFLNLIKNLYTAININILNASNISYYLHEYNNGIRYYDGNGKLLTIGDEYTPVYIENGEFKACKDIRDIFIHNNNTINPSYGELWIDPDD